MVASHRTLTQSLRELSHPELTQLLTDRPDLASPIPEGFSALAARAASPGSARRALRSLTLPELQVVEALSALGGQATLPELAYAVGLDSPAADDAAPRASNTADEPSGTPRPSEAPSGDLTAILARLRLLALAWSSEDGTIRLLTALATHMSRPAGLAPIREDDPSAEEARLLLESAPAALDRAREALAWGPWQVEGRGPLAEALIHAGVVLPDGESLRIPRSVHLALRQGRVHRTLSLTAPQLSATPLTERIPGTRNAAAAEHALHAVTILDSMRSWEADPPPVLRRGGLPQRDLRRLAAHLDTSLTSYATVLQTAWSADWVLDGDEEWLPGRDPELERRRPTEDRWAELVQAWLGSPYLASLVGSPDESGQPRALLSEALRRRGIAGRRTRLLSLLARTDGQVDVRDLYAAMHWHFPLVPMEQLTADVNAILTEAEALGLVADSAVTCLGLAVAGAGTPLVGDDDAGSPSPLSAALAVLLPPSVDDLFIDADLTLTIPGRPSWRLAGVEEWGTVISRGPGLTLRVDAHTLQAELDRGGDIDQFLATLREASRTPIPHALEVAVADARRRHGQVHVTRAHTVITASEDLIETLVSAHAAELGLRRVAPTVAISQLAAPAIVSVVKKAGLSPQELGLDGAPVRHRRRWIPRTHGTRLEATASDAAELLRRSLSASAGEGLRASVTGRLHDAIESGEVIRLGIVDGKGGVSTMSVVPLDISGGRLTAREEISGDEFTVAIHRVTLG